MNFVTGQSYEVPCTEIVLKEDGRDYFLPVIDLPHSDAAFNFPYRHYIDGRFYIHPPPYEASPDSRRWLCTDYYPDRPHPVYDFKGVVNKTLICERNETGLAVPFGSEKYAKWYQSYLGQYCAGKKCPHLDMELLEYNGKLVRPLHGLTADLKTLTIVTKD